MTGAVVVISFFALVAFVINRVLDHKEKIRNQLESKQKAEKEIQK